MKKVILHIEEIKDTGTKLQFQVKLPVTTKCITGVLATVTPNTEPSGAEGEDPRNENAGSLWLRVPEERDVFFADDVKEYNHIQQEFHGIAEPILTLQPDWWFSGWKREFFSITAPIEDTVVEGFYIDETKQTAISTSTSYLLRIYLELETND